MSLRALFFPPRQLPQPDPRCRTYTFAETVVLLRNHEQQVRMSRALQQPEEPKKA